MYELVLKPNAVTLTLYGEITEAHVGQLVGFLTTNTTLKTLSMEKCFISVTGFTSIIAALQSNTSIAELHIWDTPIVGESMDAIATMLAENTSLETLGLIEADINNKGLKDLCLALSVNKTLRVFNVRNNCGINAIGMRQLRAAIERANTTLIIVRHGILMDDDTSFEPQSPAYKKHAAAIEQQLWVNRLLHQDVCVRYNAVYEDECDLCNC